MATVTLQSLHKEIKELKSLLMLSDWFDESKAEEVVGMSPDKLRKMRNNPDHLGGWRYMGDGKDSMGREIRRNIQWSKQYISSLYKQTA